MTFALLLPWEVFMGWAGAELPPACTSWCWDAREGENQQEGTENSLEKAECVNIRPFNHIASSLILCFSC